MRFNKTHQTLLVATFATLVVLGLGVVATHNRSGGAPRYFPDSGHTVREPFLTFFDANGGIATFGYPLTEAYTSTDGSLVQTFQRAQMQLTVRGVELAPIGRALHLGDNGIGYDIAEPLQEFYAAHGGETFLGPPIGMKREQNGLLVQDFERARLVRDQQGDVHLANLGSIYLTAFPLPEGNEQAAFRTNQVFAPPDRIFPSVSVEQPVVAQGGQQTIYLFVESSDANPVVEAEALAVLRYGIASAEVEFPPTNERGLASATFVVPPAAPGSTVIIEVYVLFGEIFVTAETTYFQWW